MTIESVGWLQIIAGIAGRFWPVWLAIAVTMGLSYAFRKRLGLCGQLYDTGAGLVGLFLCLFWLFTAIFASTVATFDPLVQVAVLKNAFPWRLVLNLLTFLLADACEELIERLLPLVWMHKVLNLHLLKLTRAEDKVARADFVAKRFTLLRQTKR